MLSNQEIVEEIASQFGESVSNFEEPYELLTFSVEASEVIKLVSFLREDKKLNFNFLTDITAYHNPADTGREFCVVYHLHSFINGVRIRVKSFLPIEKPFVPSLTSLFPSADWMERETFDFYGIQFTGHPNLKRILNLDEMDYFPMRKEYAVEDATRNDKVDPMFGR